MCSEYKINGKWYENLGELALIVDACRIPFDIGYVYDIRGCLCGVDIDKLCIILNQQAVSDGSNVYFGDHIKEAKEVIASYGVPTTR